MRVIGVIGGIASGKSEVTRIFESLGAYRIDADQLGHQVLEEAGVQSQLTQRWGEQITKHGKLDRSAIARIVFGEQGNAELAFLESVTHPRIGARIEALRIAAQQAGHPAIVIDAALLLKTGWDRICDLIVFVDVPESIRIARAAERGWTAEEFRRREAAQLPLEVKRRRADVVIDNSGALLQTRAQVHDAWQQLCAESDSGNAGPDRPAVPTRPSPPATNPPATNPPATKASHKPST